MKHNAQMLVLVPALLVLLGTPVVKAQQQQTQLPESQQAPLDPILQLNLSPEQREKIRTIREQTRPERAAINQRLRETNQALDAALDADNPDEGVVEQRMKDVAAAQAASMRMRILTEVKIRRVLTLEQLEFCGSCDCKPATQGEIARWRILMGNGGKTLRAPVQFRINGMALDRFFRAALYNAGSNPKRSPCRLKYFSRIFV